MAATGAVLIGLGVSIDASKSAQRAQERGEGLAASSEATERAVARRRRVREQRIKAGQLRQSAINTGVFESSGEEAGFSSLASDLGFTSGVESQMEATSAEMRRNSRAMGKAKIKGQIGGALQTFGFQTLGNSLTAADVTKQVEQDVADIFASDPGLF
ncbi:MAG: hypothetical protein Unbinned6805contig1000_50 [Prokaryotic dsDNA virus sp.]|nr:MAG: hypothetical protein Unbinned6805contig1000_50 [Prokaryotic dsDNA virus sp.]